MGLVADADPDTATQLGKLEDLLGYAFRDRALLEEALHHATWCNEQPEPRPPNYERLEFLGDAVLGLVVGHRLMQRFPAGNQGNLSITRAQVVSEVGLSEVATRLDLGKWLYLGRGEDKSGGRTKPKIIADAFEAIVGAVYLDGGFDAATALVERLLTDRIAAAELKYFYDFKTRLQETAQARLKASPKYRVVQELGPDHAKQFEVAVMIGDDEWGRAIGPSKQKAEQMAAAEAHFRLEGSDVGRDDRRR